MGVIAACIPSLRPMVALLWRGTHRGPSLPSGKSSAQATGSSGSSRRIWPSHGQAEEQPAGGFTRLEDPRATHDRWGNEAGARGGKSGGGTASDDISLEEVNAGNPSTRIRVKREVTITSEPWDYKDRLY